MFAPWKESYNKPRQHIKKERHHFADKDLYSQSYGFSSSHVWMWELDHKEGWTPKNWFFWNGAGEDSWVPWTARRSDQSILKEINPEYSLEGLMLKLQYFGHLMWCPDSLEKTLMLWKIEGWREGATEDKMVGWHHWLSEHESEQTLGDSKEQGSLVWCSP